MAFNLIQFTWLYSSICLVGFEVASKIFISELKSQWIFSKRHFSSHKFMWMWLQELRDGVELHQSRGAINQLKYRGLEVTHPVLLKN